MDKELEEIESAYKKVSNARAKLTDTEGMVSLWEQKLIDRRTEYDAAKKEWLTVVAKFTPKDWRSK